MLTLRVRNTTFKAMPGRTDLGPAEGSLEEVAGERREDPPALNDRAGSEDEGGHSLAVAGAGGLVQGSLTLLEHGGG